MKLSTRIFRSASACAVVVSVLAIGIPTSAQPQGKKPNIVLMLMDNLGYGELGVYGGGILRGAPTDHPFDRQPMYEALDRCQFPSYGRAREAFAVALMCKELTLAWRKG